MRKEIIKCGTCEKNIDKFSKFRIEINKDGLSVGTVNYGSAYFVSDIVSEQTKDFCDFNCFVKFVLSCRNFKSDKFDDDYFELHNDVIQSLGKGE